MQVVSFTMKELNQLNDEIGTAAVYAPSPHKKRLLSVLNKIGVFLEEASDSTLGNESPQAKSQSSGVFQFKITLLGSKPPIWRRIQVQDCTLDRLHDHIQTAMGWTNSHLHQFEIKGNRYGNPEQLDDGFDDFECVDSTKTKLHDILPRKGKAFRFKYEYDFGDGWEHEILFEGCPPVDPKAKYPLCLAGARACPPEDCGGIWGYYELLEVIRDPKHEDHENRLEWIGGSFDPEEFDPQKTSKEMKRGLPDWRS
ncbi:MAG: plasmid pRiA4b ORF-3 family protein [Planctomycetes bacterium]|nr:plasmid pRiA4b ORF-3 family protein [Planctomycetota bacterium]